MKHRLLRLVFAALIGCALARLTVEPAKANALLSPQISQALLDLEFNNATAGQRALLFANNDVINLAALSGDEGISANQYQLAQKDYAGLNREFARHAGEREHARFDTQKAKSSSYSPGTDSDYILTVTSADQVRRIQNNYNDDVNAFLAKNGVGAARDDWHQKLDVDFMADPAHVKQAEFERIAEANNAAYRRREAAEFEKISRAGDGSSVSPTQFRAYGEEMREFVAHKAEVLDELRDHPERLQDPRTAAEFHRVMAQEQKYIERIEAANRLLRAQQGLPPSDAGEPRYTVAKDDAGNYVLTRVVRDGDGKTLADLGARRSSDNYGVTASADSVAQNSVNRALTDLAESMAEAGARSWKFRGAVPAAIASLTDNMSPADKGALIDRIRSKYGDGVASRVAGAMRGETSLFDARSLGDADKWLAGRLDEDLSGASRLRQSFNEQASKAMGALETVGRLKSYYDTAQLGRTVIELMRKALDPSLSAAEREAVQKNLDEVFWSLVENHGFSLLLQRMPTVAAFYGAWTIGYDGTTLILENTQTGRRINAAAAAYADANLRAADSFGADMREYLGLETDRTRQEKLYQSLLARILHDIRDHRLRLREGATAKDIGNALRDRDIALLRKDLIAPASLPPSAGLVSARMLRDRMTRLAKIIQETLPALQHDCASGEALIAKIDSDLESAESVLKVQDGGNAVARLADARHEIGAAKEAADKSAKTVTLARSVAVQHSQRVCNAARNLEKGSVQPSQALTDQINGSLRQTGSSLQLAKLELDHIVADGERADAALREIALIEKTAPDDKSKELLTESLGLIDQARALGEGLETGMGDALAAPMESARSLFRDAGQRIDAGAKGEELVALKQARAAYVSIADANDALARCRNTIAASVTAARARFDRLNAEATRREANRVLAGKGHQEEVAADISATADAARLVVQAVDRADRDAGSCSEEARNASRPATVTAWFNSLSPPEKQQFLLRARDHGLKNDNGSAFEVQKFGLLTAYFDLQLNKQHLSPDARRKKIATLAAGDLSGLASPPVR